MVVVPDNIIIVDLIADVVDRFRETGTISAITNIGSGKLKISTSNTKSLADNDEVIINSTAYVISGLVTNTSFNITSSVISATSWKAAAPYYFYGTPIYTGNIRKKDLKGNVLMKNPFIALFEPFDSNVDMDESSNIHKESDLWLAFMTACKPEDWTPSQHYSSAINPMENYVYNFYTECKKEPRIHHIDSIVETTHSNWGLVASFQGHTQKIFSENLSGVELKLKLFTNKIYSCNG